MGALIVMIIAPDIMTMGEEDSLLRGYMNVVLVYINQRSYGSQKPMNKKYTVAEMKVKGFLCLKRKCRAACKSNISHQD